MKISQLSPSDLPQLLHFNPITLNGITPTHLGGHPIDAGVALLFNAPHDPSLPLLKISHSLILSQRTIEVFSKSDRQLSAALAAAGNFAQSPRGACIIFLLLRQATTAGFIAGSGGVRDAWTTYTQFLPSWVPLPTTWENNELALLAGTSLDFAISAKLRALNAEFEAFYEAVSDIEWWDTEELTLQDWVHADALFRSRSLELPGFGESMVPVLDFANHAGDGKATARYAVDEKGEVLLELVGEWKEGEEVTIDYSGGEKSAAEMAFSYGFIPTDMATAGSLTLDLPPSEDDPLGRAKMVVWKGPKTVRIFETSEETVDWEAPFAYLCSVNEEDELAFHVLQDNNGQKHLQVLFRGEELDIPRHPERILEMLRESDNLLATSVTG